MTIDSEASKLIKLAKELDSKKASDIRIFDVQNLSEYISYFIFATALSRSHLRALTDEAVRVASSLGIRLVRHDSPQHESGWVALDFGYLIIHLFDEEKRKFYNLDELWSKGKEIIFQENRPYTVTPPKGEKKISQDQKTAKKKTKRVKSTNSESFSKKMTKIEKEKKKEIKMATKKKTAKKPAKKAAKKTVKKAAKKK